MLLGKPVESDKWISGVTTSQGSGRYAVRVYFMGEVYKVIINAVDIKSFLDDMTRNKVTRFKTVFIDKESLHYGIDEKQTEILEVDGRKVKEAGDRIVFEDTGEEVVFH